MKLLPNEKFIVPGDVFATRNPQNLGKLICWAQMVKSQDGEAKYGHTGIIQNPSGKTLEAVWKIREQDLFEAYKGDEVLVARWHGMGFRELTKGMRAVCPLKNRLYPFHRLALHALGLAKWVHWFKTPVCSELTALFLVAAGAKLYCGDEYWGVTPDNLVDDWRINREIEIVFEGVLE